MSGDARTKVDKVWKVMVTLVMDSREDWRRKVADATGLPFSRARVLRRLDKQPLTLRELAEAIGSDAPAATVAVNDLERRGLVERRPHPDDRRAKIVSLTAEGRHTLAAARRVTEHAPEAFAELPTEDVAELTRILKRFGRG